MFKQPEGRKKKIENKNQDEQKIDLNLNNMPTVTFNVSDLKRLMKIYGQSWGEG